MCLGASLSQLQPNENAPFVSFEEKALDENTSEIYNACAQWRNQDYRKEKKDF